MDYLLSRENDAQIFAKMSVARSVAVIDISLVYYFSGLPDATSS